MSPPRPSLMAPTLPYHSGRTRRGAIDALNPTKKMPSCDKNAECVLAPPPPFLSFPRSLQTNHLVPRLFQSEPLPQTCAKCAGVRVLATFVGEQNLITRSQPWFNLRLTVPGELASGAAASPLDASSSSSSSPPAPPLPSSLCRSDRMHVSATCLAVSPRRVRARGKCLDAGTHTV